MPVTLEIGSRGPEVVKLQNALKKLGWDRTGPSDGIFGAMTARSVRAFQASSGLEVDGIAGPATRAAIAAALEGQPPAPGEGAPATPGEGAPAVPAVATPWAHGLLTTALAEVGVVEKPLGSNGGPRVDEYTGKWRVPWCALFVSWCIRQQPSPSIEVPIAAVVRWREWLVARDRWSTDAARRAPAPGDIFVILYEGADGVDSGHGHVGLVVDYDANARTIRTVEGNTSNGVRSKRRPLAGISGWGPVDPG